MDSMRQLSGKECVIVSFSMTQYPEDKAERYALLLRQADALMEGIAHPMVQMANISALLYAALPDINWCGFYLMHEGSLLLGPFCGLPACVRIQLGRGVCGTAAAQNHIQRVADVHAFPGHIACDSASRSEIVLPLCHQGRVVAVLDIDSPLPCRFDETDEIMLSRLVSSIMSHCDFTTCHYSLR